MSDRPTPLCDAVVRDSDGFLETARNMEKLARRLERQRDAAVEALTKIDKACESIPETIEGWLEPLSDALADARAVLREIEGES